MSSFIYDWSIGGLFVSSFAVCAIFAIAICLALRPAFRSRVFQRTFQDPSLAEISIFVCILAAFVVAH